LERVVEGALLGHGDVTDSLAALTLGYCWVVPERLPTHRPMRVALGLNGAISAIIAPGK
jgi:hypothetical protein